MKSFFNLIQSIVNVKIKTYPDEPFKILNFTYTSEQSNINYIINQIYYLEKKRKL